MTCRDATDFLTDYLAGDLSPSLADAFESHLAECENCVAFLEQFEACIRAGRLAYMGPCAPPDCDLPEDLVQTILIVVSRARR